MAPLASIRDSPIRMLPNLDVNEVYLESPIHISRLPAAQRTLYLAAKQALRHYDATIMTGKFRIDIGKNWWRIVLHM